MSSLDSLPAIWPKPTSTEIEEALAFYDSDRDGLITFSEFVTVVRSVGYAPINAELNELDHFFGSTDGGQVGYSDAKKLISSYIASKALPPAKLATMATDALNEFNTVFRPVRNEKTGQKLSKEARKKQLEEKKETVSVRDVHMLLTQYGDSISSASSVRLVAETLRNIELRIKEEEDAAATVSAKSREFASYFPALDHCIPTNPNADKKVPKDSIPVSALVENALVLPISYK